MVYVLLIFDLVFRFKRTVEADGRVGGDANRHGDLISRPLVHVAYEVAVRVGVFVVMLHGIADGDVRNRPGGDIVKKTSAHAVTAETDADAKRLVLNPRPDDLSKHDVGVMVLQHGRAAVQAGKVYCIARDNELFDEIAVLFLVVPRVRVVRCATERDFKVFSVNIR